MVKNQTILHPAAVNLGKGDSRYGNWNILYGLFFHSVHIHFNQSLHKLFSSSNFIIFFESQY